MGLVFSEAAVPVLRRCLDCPRLLRAGSRCPTCARNYRSPYSRHQWPDQVKRRDGYRCIVPGCPTPTDRIQADHTVPLSQGGLDSPENGQTLCHSHHKARHSGG